MKKISISNTILDTKEILESCYKLKDMILEMYDCTEVIGTKTTSLYKNYNLLLFPFPGFHELFHAIRDEVSYHLRTGTAFLHEKKLYLQCWLNYYEPGQFIPYHGHWEKELNTLHGHFCVKGHNTVTTYQTEEGEKEIINKEGQIVLTDSDGFKHRTWPSEEERITIAFDIVPRESITWGVNHWIPL